MTEGDTPRAPAAVWSLGVPVLGICYGMQTMAAQLGGSGRARQGARVRLRRGARARTFDAAARHRRTARNDEGHGLLDVWMSHGDKVTALPPGFKADRLVARPAPIAAMADEARGFYAVQFHPEVTHTKQGAAILARFAHDICGCGERLEHARLRRRGRARRSARRSAATR